MEAPQRPARKTGWNTYYPWLLGLSATFSGLALVFVAISWIPVEPLPGVPSSPLSGPYLPGGLTILLAVVAGRQIFLRRQSRRTASATAASPVASGSTESRDARATEDERHAPPELVPDARRRVLDVGWWGIVGIAVTGVTALLVLLVVIGFSNGYSHRVVDQVARGATTYEEFAGTYSVVDRGGQLCASGDDYYACVEMHRAMFNSICASRPLNAIARSTCDRLSAFVADTQARYASCGYGCTTSGSGPWGWSYHTLEADTVMVSSEALPQISHEERCDFDLGVIRFGQCPGRDG
jgi:hypothetical protein